MFTRFERQDEEDVGRSHKFIYVESGESDSPAILRNTCGEIKTKQFCVFYHLDGSSESLEELTAADRKHGSEIVTIDDHLRRPDVLLIKAITIRDEDRVARFEEPQPYIVDERPN